MPAGGPGSHGRPHMRLRAPAGEATEQKNTAAVYATLKGGGFDHHLALSCRHSQPPQPPLAGLGGLRVALRPPTPPPRWHPFMHELTHTSPPEHVSSSPSPPPVLTSHPSGISSECLRFGGNPPAPSQRTTQQQHITFSPVTDWTSPFDVLRCPHFPSKNKTNRHCHCVGLHSPPGGRSSSSSGGE